MVNKEFVATWVRVRDVPAPSANPRWFRNGTLATVSIIGLASYAAKRNTFNCTTP
jgi:hypothetical protein